MKRVTRERDILKKDISCGEIRAKRLIDEDGL